MKLNIEIKKVTKSLCAVFLAWGVMFSPFAKPIFATETDEDERIDELIEEETTTIVETTTVETTTLAETTTTAATILEETLIDDFTVELLADDLQSSSDQNDKYAISIEFGALHFYYDWGTWDTQQHEYKSDPSSSGPAVGTTSGKPGWYGFDGQNNLIKISNTSPHDNGVKVTIQFTMDEDARYTNDAGQVGWVDLKESEIKMALYQGGSAAVNGDETKTVFAFGEQHTSGTWDQYGYTIFLEKGETETMYISFDGEPIYQNSGAKYNGNNAELPHAFGFLVITVGVEDSVNFSDDN